MRNSYKFFKEIIDSSKESLALHNYLVNTMKVPFSCDDILRWQWAQSVSALDKLIHDLVRIGMIEIAKGEREKTLKYNSFRVNLNNVESIISNVGERIAILDKSIVEQHSFLSFQDPKKISEALSYYWNEDHKWQKISQKMGIDESVVKTQLNNIIIRRNQIVHEGDYSSELLDRQEIESNDVIEILEFIHNVGSAIYDLTKISS